MFILNRLPKPSVISKIILSFILVVALQVTVHYKQYKQAFLMYVENLEKDNSLKWVLFHVVSGQITSYVLWE